MWYGPPRWSSPSLSTPPSLSSTLLCLTEQLKAPGLVRILWLYEKSDDLLDRNQRGKGLSEWKGHGKHLLSLGWIWTAGKTDARLYKNREFQLDLANVSAACRKKKKNPTSCNSSESFHSIGEQLALTELTPLSPISWPSSTLSFPLVSLHLLSLSRSWCYCKDFPESTSLPPPQPLDMVSTPTAVTDWTMRHMTSVQTRDKNKIRHVC